MTDHNPSPSMTTQPQLVSQLVPQQVSPTHGQRRTQPLHRQRGFTLIEIMAGIAILGIMTMILMGSFSGNTSKAVRLLSDMNTISNSAKRAQMELGGIPSRLSVLWNRTDATAANMFNGIAATNSWNGPYLERQPTDANNNITEFDVADAATIAIAREAASAANGGNYTWVYYLRANNIPNAIIVEFIKKCAAVDVVANATFANGKCRATLGTGATEFGTVDIKIADSR